MPRGVRKSPLEKLQQELLQVQEAVQQYKDCLVTLKEKEKELVKEMEAEEFKEVKELMSGQNLTMDDLKQMITDTSVCQSAS